MGCCESFSKTLLIIFNVLFFIIGAVILGVGIWVKVDKSNLFEIMRKIQLNETADSLNNTSNSILNIIAIILIVVGVFTFLTGFCGCCGAIKESQCLLYLYTFLVAAVIIVEIGIGIYAGVEKAKFTDMLEKSLQSILKKDFNGITASNPTLFTKLFTAVMFELKCCGVHNVTDFKPIDSRWQHNINGSLQVNPVGCCKTKDKFTYDPNDNKMTIDTIIDSLVDKKCPTNATTTEMYTDGCVTSLINFINQNLGIVIGVCVGLGLFEILCIIFACVVARKDK